MPGIFLLSLETQLKCKRLSTVFPIFTHQLSTHRPHIQQSSALLPRPHAMRNASNQQSHRMPLKGDSTVWRSCEQPMKPGHCSQLFPGRRCLTPVSRRRCPTPVSRRRCPTPVRPPPSAAAAFRTVPFGLGFRSRCQVPRRGLRPPAVPVASLMWGWGAGPPSLISLSLGAMGCGHHLGHLS